MRAWGGDVTALWTSQLLGMTVKLVVPTNIHVRKNEADGRQPAVGRDIKANNYDVNRNSCSFSTRHTGQQEWRVHGQKERVIYNITTALTTGCIRTMIIQTA